jgi:tetratricopeptide (TPR) repeat protein
MHRSPVKSGIHVQRSRATTRRRDRNEEPAHEPDAHDRFRAWLKEHIRPDFIREVNALYRKRFLQETGHFDVPPGERLRLLAIHAESEAAVANQPEGWCALRSIYEHALRFNEPGAWAVYNSMAISALEMLWRPGEESDVRERIVAEAIAAGARAVELAPKQATTHYWLGRCYLKIGRNPEVLACAEAGIGADPRHGWSALLRADTLNDLQRWDEAIRAYNAVPLDFFKGPIGWRVDWLKECRAWCRLQQGDREGALAEFLALLSRYEANLGLADRVDPTHLVDAAAGPLRQELQPRVLALAQQLAWNWYIGDLEGPPMTPAQWPASNDPRALLEFLERGTTRRTLGTHLTRRKQVLLVLRRTAEGFGGMPSDRAPGSDLEAQVDEVLRRAADLAERLVEGGGGAAELADVRAAIERARTANAELTEPLEPIPNKLRWASSLLDLATGEADLLDLPAEPGEPTPFPPGFVPESADVVREVIGDPFRRGPGIAPEWLAWNGGVVLQLARTIYEELAFGLMPVLADALQEAGCTDEALLDHCRSSAGHLRGCWALDLVLCVT